MKKDRRTGLNLVLVSVVCYLLLISVPIDSRAQETEEDTSFVPESLYDSMELLDNTNLEEPVSFEIQGDSGEFSHTQNLTAGSLTLNWTHVAGTELDYDLSNPNYPESLEYVYFSQEFDWEYNVLPTATRVTVEYSVSTTGTFQEATDSMFFIRSWMVYPDGHWMRVVRSDYDASNWLDNGHYLRDYETSTLFTQVHGLDQSARLVLGLVPSSYFLGDMSDRPWQYYNGSVLATFNNVSIDVMFRTDNEFPSQLEPSYEITWNQGFSERYLDSCLGPTGNTLILSSYDTLYTGSLQYHTLTMLDYRAEVIWRMNLTQNDIHSFEFVKIHQDRIYLLGTIRSGEYDDSLHLIALDWNGELLWNTTYEYHPWVNLLNSEISSQGEIYIGLTYNNSIHLLKIDHQGDLLWEEEIGPSDMRPFISLAVIEEGYIYTQTRSELSLWNEEGVMQWSNEIPLGIVGSLADGSILMGDLDNLTKLTVDGEILWSKNMRPRYAGSWVVRFDVISMKEGNDGIVYLLLGNDYFHPGSILVQIDSYGNHLKNETLAISQELHSPVDVPEYSEIHISENNVVYLCGVVVNNSVQINPFGREWASFIIFSVYSDEPLFFGTQIGTIITTVVASSILVVTIILWQVRRERS